LIARSKRRGTSRCRGRRRPRLVATRATASRLALALALALAGRVGRIGFLPCCLGLTRGRTRRQRGGRADPARRACLPAGRALITVRAVRRDLVALLVTPILVAGRPPASPVTT